MLKNTDLVQLWLLAAPISFPVGKGSPRRGRDLFRTSSEGNGSLGGFLKIRLKNLRIKLAFYPDLEVVLVQCKKLKQYPNESKNHFEPYAEISLVKNSKSIFVDMANCHILLKR